MNDQLDLMCVADLCVDVILSGNVRPQFGQVEQLVDDYDVQLGGSASIFASQFAKLGARAGIIGAVGNDNFGDFVLDQLRKNSVDISSVHRDATIKTGAGVSLTEPNDRAILTYLGSIDAVGPDDLLKLPMTFRHWHLASYFLLKKLRKFWPQWLKKLRAQKIPVSLDSNWDPDGGWLTEPCIASTGGIP